MSFPRMRFAWRASRLKHWAAKPLPAPSFLRAQTPAAIALPLSEDLRYQMKEELLAQPIARFPGVVPKAYPLWSESKSEKLLFLPRFSSSVVDIDDSLRSVMKEPELTEGEDMNGDLQMTAPLRDHQTAAVSATLRGLQDVGGAVLVLPCGGGKTVCGLHIAHRLKKRTLVVVHKTFLLEQWKERIQSFIPGAKIGILQGQAARPDADSDFVIAMLQTLAGASFKDVEALKPFGLVIVDECHHIGARMFSNAMWRIPAKYVLGLSATPERADGLTPMLHYFLGPLTYTGESNANNTEVEVQIVKAPAPEVSDVEYSQYVTLLTEHAPRNAAIAEIANKQSESKQVLVLSERVSHLETLRGLIEKQNPARSVGTYTGTSSAADRRRAEECDIILGTYQMASEGLDIPTLSVVVLSTPRKAISQSIGRVLRSSNALVVDIVDKFGANKDRLRFYQQEGYAIKHL